MDTQITCYGKDQQMEIRKYVKLALELPEEWKSLVIAWIVIVSDKKITENMKQYLTEALAMTEIGKSLIEEGRQKSRPEGDYERARKIAFKMHDKKYSLEHIAEIIEFPISTIQEWLTEFHVKA